MRDAQAKIEQKVNKTRTKQEQKLEQKRKKM